MIICIISPKKLKNYKLTPKNENKAVSVLTDARKIWVNIVISDLFLFSRYIFFLNLSYRTMSMKIYFIPCAMSHTLALVLCCRFSQKAFKWFSENFTIVNLDKCSIRWIPGYPKQLLLCKYYNQK